VALIIGTSATYARKDSVGDLHPSLVERKVLSTVDVEEQSSVQIPGLWQRHDCALCAADRHGKVGHRCTLSSAHGTV
jgi:hypothetical protein